MTTGDGHTGDPMIGLIGGLAVGAAIHYDRGLAAAHDDRQRPLRLRTAGAPFGVMPAITPHPCIGALKRITPRPVVDITRAVADHVHARQLSKSNTLFPQVDCARVHIAVLQAVRVPAGAAAPA